MKNLPWRDARTRKAILRVCCATFAIMAVASHLAAEESVTAVRFWTLGDITRIAVETTGQFEFHSDRLVNPDRIFFDLPGTRPQLGRKTVNVIPVGDQFVRQIRVAETQRGVTRIVLDLQAAVDVSTSQLANPDRLIIELRRPGSRPATEVAHTPARIEGPVVEAPPPPRAFQPPTPEHVPEFADRRKTVVPTLDPPATESANLPTPNAPRND